MRGRFYEVVGGRRVVSDVEGCWWEFEFVGGYLELFFFEGDLYVLGFYCWVV